MDDASLDGMVGTLVRLFCRAGGPYAGEEALHAPRLAFEWKLGQWVIVMGPQSQLWGWMSWYRLDSETLGVFRRGEDDDLIRRRIYPDVVGGEHCWIASTVVTPWAPRATYRALFDLAASHNEDATSIAAMMVTRRDRERFMQRWNDGSPGWWRRYQNDWRAQCGPGHEAIRATVH